MSSSAEAGDSAPPLGLPPASCLSSYELLETLGRGAAGVVFKARQRHPIERLVALKLLHAEDVRRFHREIQAAARLHHRHLVPLLEVGAEGTQLFFTMPFLAGGNLAQHLGRYHDDPRAAVALMEKVARAVQYAHDQGVWHRDLKPANILLDEQGEPLVADFGLAKLGDAPHALTETGRVLGTPAYLSPEQAAGQSQRVGPATDVWALGVILYELLGGQRPFSAATRDELWRRIREQQPRPLRSLRRDLPPELEAICLKCLEKRPAARYAGAGHLADDLVHWLRGEPLSVRAPGWLGHAWRRLRARPPGVLVVISGCCLVLLTFLLLGKPPARPEEDEHRIVEHADRERRVQEYDFRVAEASRAWQAGRPVKAEILLTEPELDLREFAWFYLWHQLRNGCRLLGKHPAPVESLAMSPDGRWIATGGAAPDSQARLWQLQTGTLTPLSRFAPGHCYVAFSAEGKLLAGSGSEGGWRLWDIATSTEQPPLPDAGGGTVVAFSPDGRWVVGGHDHTLSLWDWHTRQRRKTLEGIPGFCSPSVSFSPDSALLAWAHGDHLDVCALTREGLPLIRQEQIAGLRQVALCADSWLAYRLADQPAVFVRQLAGGDAIVLPCRGKAETLAVSPDGRSLAAAVERTAGEPEQIHCWDLAQLADAQARPRSDSPARSWSAREHAERLVFTPDGRAVVYGRQNLFLQPVARCAKNRVLGRHAGECWALAWSPDGKLLATAGADRWLRTWDVAEGREAQALRIDDTSGRALVWTAEGPRLCTPDEARTQRRQEIIGRLPELAGMAVDLNVFDVSSDGRTLAVGAADGALGLWDLRTGRELLRVPGQDGPIRSVAFAPHGTILATAGAEGQVLLWEASREPDP